MMLLMWHLHSMLLWIVVASLTVLATSSLLNSSSSSSSSLVIDTSASVVRVGDSVQLTCNLEQSLHTTPNVYTAEDITWFRVIEDETRPLGLTALVNNSSSDVTLVNVSITDSGVYQCCVTDSCEVSANIQIQVGLPPTPATNLTCYSFNFRSATCEWVKGGQHSHLESTDLLQVKQPSKTEWKNCAFQIPDNICSSRSNGCKQQCASKYAIWEYRINTTNALGSDFSESVFFSVDDSKLHPPENVEARNESATALMVTWSLPRELREADKYLVEYKLQYRFEESSTWKSKEGIIPKKVEIKYQLSDLTHPYGLYYIRVQAIYDDVISEYSAEVKARTSEIVPVDVPEHFYCEDQLSDKDDSMQVLLTWDPAPNKYKPNGEIFGYVINYKTSDTSNPEVHVVNTEANDTSWTVKDLKKGHHYIFTIQTRNSMGISVKKEDCKVDPIPLGHTHVWNVIGGCFGIVVLLIVVTTTWLCLKRSIRKFPDINMPVHRVAPMDCGHVNQVLVRETEVFDDPIPCQLFVSLDPKETSREAIFTDIITDGFDIGDKPRGAVGFQDAFERHPLLGLTVDLSIKDSPMAEAPLLPSSRREEDPSSGEEYGGMSPSSPLSVGSGGSYLHIRDDDEVIYSRMTRDGLSPVETQDIEGQRVRGERSMDFPTGAPLDGLPQLHWRPESVSEEPGDLQDGDIDHSTNLSRPTIPIEARGSSGPGLISKDDQRFKPSSGQKKPKQPPVETPTQENSGNLAGATYVGDGSIASYVRQGFLPDPSPTDYRESDDQANAPIGSYCQVGAQGEISFDAPRGSYLVSSPGPTSPTHRVNIPLLNQAVNDEMSADNQDEGDSSGDEIVSYVLSAGTLPSTRPSQSMSQTAQDSQNPPGSQGAVGSVPPSSEPVSQTRDASNPRNILNAFINDGELSVESFSDYEDEGQGADSNINHRDGMNGTEQADMSGYVTQGMIPNGIISPASRTITGIAPIPSAAESGYVDQEQLPHITSPHAIPSPTQHNPGQQNDIMVGDYVTQGQDLSNRPAWFPANSADESPINYNNNNSGMLNSILHLPDEPEESVLDRDNVTGDHVSEAPTSSENASCDEESGGRDSPHAAGSIDYGTPDHAQTPAYLSVAAVNDAVHVNGAQAEASNGINGYHVDQGIESGYISQEQMLNIAAKGSAKTVNAHHDRQDD